MKHATERLWRTDDGKLVRDGDELAASLAYAPGDEIAARDESLVPGDEDVKAPEVPGDEDVKAAETPANKMAAKPANKAR